jgi:dTDP-N-acetylfucosamine:lipid II N-acetylfucosaminyltransferase
MFLERKFTLPLYNHIINNLGLKNHNFLLVDQDCIMSQNNSEQVKILKSPLRKHLLHNLRTFYSECNKAEIILGHAAPLSFFFILFPKFIKKVYWIIHGGIDIPSLSIQPQGLQSKIDILFKKKIPFHVTHITEDSDFVNKLLNKKASHIYSPMYLSNTARVDQFKPKSGTGNVNVLAGNSTDPSNNHFELFDLIYPHLSSIDKIYSILSYGIYEEYKKKVIRKGEELFGDKFVPVLDFMSADEYNGFLKGIDVVTFNHRRQEAMGVTINLIALGKIIYMNSKSPAFLSFKKRGFLIYDLEELKLNNINMDRDISNNKHLIEDYYSIEVLNRFLINL